LSPIPLLNGAANCCSASFKNVRCSNLWRHLLIGATFFQLSDCPKSCNSGKGDKDRIVPFPEEFKEVLGLHAENLKDKGATYLFESSWKKPYTDRGIRKILERYAQEAELDKTISPHKLRHFLFTWLKKQGIDDALIQPYSGHASRQSLEVYSRLSIADAQAEYSDAIRRFPV
jgi:integrase/recombinase XerD